MTNNSDSKVISSAISNQQQYFEGQDLSHRLSKITELIKDQLGVSSLSPFGASDYYGTGKVGAVHYLAEYQGQQVVVKIQGVKPAISEVDVIAEFVKQNRSQMIRSPQVIARYPWNDEHQFEAVIMEYVQGEKLLSHGEFHSRSKIEHFFEYFKEYRRNCVVKPWLKRDDKQSIAQIITQKYDGLLRISKDVKPNSPYRESKDGDLVKTALKVLCNYYDQLAYDGGVSGNNDKNGGRLTESNGSVLAVFQHGHFSTHDLVLEVKSKTKEIVLFSNLFWRWAHPYYDAVFAYHWFMYSLAVVGDRSEKDLKQQGDLWLEQIEQLAAFEDYDDSVVKLQSKQRAQLINAALLERAAAGLLIDAFAYIDKEQPLAKAVVDRTRRELERLLAFFK